MATDKQIAANRRNARRSTGPRTIEGKARAAQNSLRHGVLAKPALLPDEDQDAFCEFVEQIVSELDPVGPLESDFAQQIAFHMWRLNRFARVEAGLFIADRAERDYKYFWDLVMRYQTTGLDREMKELVSSLTGGDDVQISDEARHADAMQNLSAAAKERRSELAFLGSAFASAAANGDPLGKLGRYETAAHNRLRRLLATFNELQARRKGAPRESDGREGTPS